MNIEIVMRGRVPRIHVFLICFFGSVPLSRNLPSGAIFTAVQNGDSALSDERSDPIVDPACIDRALQRLTAKVTSLCDDMHVLTAIVPRLDNSQGRMLEEVRAMHGQQSRVGN
jgi:hypothetical protein